MLTLALLAGAFVGFGAFVVLAYRRHWHWTGLPAAPASSKGVEDRPAKTLWDWLQLLGIPVALVALAFLLTDAQSRRDQRRAADAERERTLRTYLTQMSNLMLDRKLLRAKTGAEVRTVARTATLTVMRRLDGGRRGLLVRFLAEAGLVGRAENYETAIVQVALGDFTEAKLRGADLREVDLSGADLGKADLRQTFLLRSDLSNANLSGADLRGARLVKGKLQHTYFVEASLSDADFGGGGPYCGGPPWGGPAWGRCP